MSDFPTIGVDHSYAGYVVTSGSRCSQWMTAGTLLTNEIRVITLSMTDWFTRLEVWAMVAIAPENGVWLFLTCLIVSNAAPLGKYVAVVRGDSDEIIVFEKFMGEVEF